MYFSNLTIRHTFWRNYCEGCFKQSNYFPFQLASVSAKPDDRILKCCQYGISKATASVMMGEEKFGCLLDDAMMNTIHQEVTLVNEFEKIICKTLFKQCCIGSAKSQFCVAGIGMGK